MNILVVVGTRPEIIKMAPVVKLLNEKCLDFMFVHTGQHYDYEMSVSFIKELSLPNPNITFELSNSRPASQIAEMIFKLENSLDLLDGKAYIMLIEGDTNTILAAAIAAIKMRIKIGHVEAGLRSFDWRMPEEHNRRMVDHVSDYLFAPTNVSKSNLENEHVWGKIFVTGNTIIDAIDIYFDKVKEIESKVMEQIRFHEYALLTFHRSENVDDPYTLKNFIKILENSPLPIVFPIHPRTKRRLIENNLMKHIESLKNVQLLPPQAYFEFLTLMKNSKIIMTDSGGLQEEATHPKIRKPLLVLRTSTERPEAVQAGFAKVVGISPKAVLSELENLLNNRVNLPTSSPFGDGKASERIIDIILSNL
ncbi:MAG: UDP-N-acetylglucosamine 2-epimerase (non-hydrolyzing) [Nitrososphaeria archaeon]